MSFIFGDFSTISKFCIAGLSYFHPEYMWGIEQIFSLGGTSTSWWQTSFKVALGKSGFCFIFLLELSLYFSNSLIIHAALTQPEHLILVRWMSLETQWKPSWKHGRAWKPCFKLFETRMQIFLICILIKQQKHAAINNYLITHFTKQTLNLNYLLLTLNVTVQLSNYPKQKSTFFFLNFKFSLNGCCWVPCIVHVFSRHLVPAF